MIPLLFDTIQGRARSAVHSVTSFAHFAHASLLIIISLLIFSANSFVPCEVLGQIPALSVTKLAAVDSFKVEGQNVTSFFTTLSDSNTTNTSTIGDSTISQQKLTQSLIDVINAAGGGSITNNPDEVTITVSGGLLGVKASSLTTSFLDGSHTFDFAAGLTALDIGVNTSSPQSLVDIQGDAGAAGILTLATKELTVVDGNELGRIDFNAPLESSGSDAILAGAAIWAEADITFSNIANNSELVFGTATTSAAVERMRIDSGGLVGIGTATPDKSLEIEATAAHIHLDSGQSANILLDKGAATREASVIFETAGTPDWYMGTPDSDVAGDGGEFFISTSSQGVSSAFWIEAGGNVGIDNNNPATKLHVVGNITLGDSTTGDIDAILYFADDASVTAESIMWNDGNSQFELSDDIDVTGNVVVSGTVDGKDIATNAAMLNEAETIGANWDNTANPWDFSTEVTGEATPDLIQTDGQVDEYVLSYEATGDSLQWKLISAVGDMLAADMRDSVNAYLGDSLGVQVQAFNTRLLDLADGTIVNDFINTTNPWADNEVTDALTVTGYMQDEDINTFSELQSWVSNKTLVNEEDVFTIDANWVNTASPWVDNEVADAITVTGYMQDEDINTFSELQAWVSDKTLVNEEDVFTIDTDWVNVANPWADNEVADNITITNISQVADISATASEINTPLDGASVTLTEFQELETIGATTISANQWATLGGIAETLGSAELDLLDGKSLAGADASILTGTAGTNTYVAVWNTDGDLVDGAGVPYVVGGTDVADADVADDITLTNLSQVSDAEEAVEDYIGAGMSGNTETGIAVTYQDADGTFDFVAEVTQVEYDLISDDTTDYNTAYTHSQDNTQAHTDYLLNSGDIGTGAYDFGGATDFEVENGADPTVDTAGEIAVDVSDTSGAALRFYADAEYTLPAWQRLSFVIDTPIATSDYSLGSFPANITIRKIRVLCTGGTNLVGGLDEADANGASPVAVDSDITATAGTTALDDKSLTNPTIDKDDMLNWHTTSISGTPTSVTVTVYYTYDAVN